jgi:hypothetical protein
MVCLGLLHSRYDHEYGQKISTLAAFAGCADLRESAVCSGVVSIQPDCDARGPLSLPLFFFSPHIPIS